MLLRHTPLNEQEATVVRLHRDEKQTQRRVAEQLGISLARVAQVYSTAKARLKDFEENGDEALSRLPLRAARLVTNLGIASRAQTRAAIESGRLAWLERRGGLCWDERRLRNAGWDTWVVLHEWTNLPQPPPRWDSTSKENREHRRIADSR